VSFSVSTVPLGLCSGNYTPFLSYPIASFAWETFFFKLDSSFVVLVYDLIRMSLIHIKNEEIRTNFQIKDSDTLYTP
jgi:hypothetical protein